ncbi:MAG: cupin domain-containing protein [Alphaproteobacteria bacterium]|nr:cupin domain-containing protein [Alphaproteobacteria bacterium]
MVTNRSKRPRLPKLPALDPTGVPAIKGSSAYPPPFRAKVAGRIKQRLGDALGLRNFGVNLTRLEPGAWSALRHWHTRQDEFIYIVSGEATLVTDRSRQVLTAGMIAGFPAGRADGHHLINRSKRDVVYLEVGDRMPGDEAAYPDDDLFLKDKAGARSFVHKTGKPW